MKKIYSISSIIIITFLIILSSMYFYASYKTKKDYSQSFNHCKEIASKFESQLDIYPESKKCIDEGGCYTICESGCGLPRSSINFPGMINFYFGYFYITCPDSCTHGCLYLLE